MTADEMLRSELIGIWKDLEDIGDSPAYARQLREQAQRRREDFPKIGSGIRMGNILIRQATESDLPAIEKLMAELMEAVDDGEGFSTNMVSGNYQNLLNNDSSHILVAESDGAVTGIINVAIRRTLLHPGASGLIDELVVTESYRGKGVGKKLIHAAVERCRELGCCEIEVSTEVTNINARKFYKSNR